MTRRALVLATTTAALAGAAPRVTRWPASNSCPAPAESRLGLNAGWMPLGTLPTAVTREPGLAQALGVGELWIKHDERAGAPLGGSKVRKLEFCLGAARRAGATRLLTFGGVSSNHLVATAFYGRRAGFAVEAWVAAERPSRRAAQVLRYLAQLGVELKPAARAPTWQDARRLEHRRGERVWLIPAGGSSALGNLGYVLAGLELGDQVREHVLPAPDAVLVAGGTLGTAAGLALGLGLAGLGSELWVVRAASRATCNPSVLARKLSELRVVAPRARAAPLLFEERAVGRGYGLPTPAAERWVREAKQRAGLELETTYTGKALAGLAQLGATRKRVLLFDTYHAALPALAGSAQADFRRRIPTSLLGYLRWL